MSERDGWNHLYLYDGTTGKVKNQITKGNWVVRGVDSVDVAKRQIWFRASGMNPDQDPYFVHYYRINFDGTGLTAYTDANGTHAVSFSPDHALLRRPVVPRGPAAGDAAAPDRRPGRGRRAGAGATLRRCWPPAGRYPEVFLAKGRDGKTDIWGSSSGPPTSTRRRSTRSSRTSTPGPHGSFVPKTFSTQRVHAGARGAGLHRGHSRRNGNVEPFARRSRTSHGRTSKTPVSRTVSSGTRPSPRNTPSTTSVAWGSTGPRPAARTRWPRCSSTPSSTRWPCPSAGCHDNRMDKIWWNELWMGWPIGPQYAASSNVDNA